MRTALREFVTCLLVSFVVFVAAVGAGNAAARSAPAGAAGPSVATVHPTPDPHP
jgi:hypothetical protein